MAKKTIYDPTFNSPATNIKKLLSNGNLIWLRALTNPKTGLQEKFPVVQKTGETVEEFYQRIDKMATAGRVASKQGLVSGIKENRKIVIDWSNNWFKENFKKNKYKPRDVNKFIENYKNDWSKEIKAKGYKDFTLFKYKDSIGFPPVSTKKK